MTDWRKIIEDNEEEIKEQIKKVEVDAYLNNHMRFSLYIDADGDFSVLEDVAGGNSFYSSENLFCLHTAEHQCYDVLDTYGGDTEALIFDLRSLGEDTDNLITDLCEDLEIEEDEIDNYFGDFVSLCEGRCEENLNAVREEIAENEAEESVDVIFENITDNLDRMERYA